MVIQCVPLKYRFITFFYNVSSNGLSKALYIVKLFQASSTYVI